MDVSCIPQQSAAAYSSLYFFIFLSLQFSNIKHFVAFFSGTRRHTKLELGTHMDNGCTYRVYRNQAVASYSSLLFLDFASSRSFNKSFVTLFSGTVRPSRLKVDTHVDNGWTYKNQAVAAYLSLYFCICLSLQFSTINLFRHIFLKNCDAYKVETCNACGQCVDVFVYRNQAAAAYLSLYFFMFSFSLILKHYKVLSLFS